MMFLVSEVHPFVDGNGRIARIMMNAELVAVVPWADLESTRQVLERCHAFVDPSEADDRGIRLRLPS